MSLLLRAFAKINLTLRVGPRRSDGFHELKTRFQSIELHDELRFEKRPGPFEIAGSLPGVPTDRTNLIWTAAAAVWTASGRPGEPEGVRVVVTKNIPVQSGLGGGSSDAAATLLGVSRLLDAGLDRPALQQVGRGLGSDVPFFLWGGTADASGRGDDVHAVGDLPPHWLVIVVPGFGVSTAEAYGWLDADRAATAGGVAERPWHEGAGGPANDFQEVVARRHPVVHHIANRLCDLGATQAALSGSGSAMFGTFTARESAEAARAAMEREGFKAILSRTLDRAEFTSRLFGAVAP